MLKYVQYVTMYPDFYIIVLNAEAMQHTVQYFTMPGKWALKSEHLKKQYFVQYSLTYSLYVWNSR
jgi:hypothetical protein